MNSHRSGLALLGLLLGTLASAGCASRPPLWNPGREAELQALEARLVELERSAVRYRLEIERLERRLAALEAARSAASEAPRPARTPPPSLEEAPPPAEPLRPGLLGRQPESSDLDEEEAPAAESPEGLYRRALETVRAGQLGEGEQLFRRFATLYPQSDLADNAWFWIGESLFLQGKYREAVEAYREGIERYPEGNKTPDALFKLGSALASAGDPGRSLEVWRELVRRFPASEAAQRAREHLPGR